MESRRKSGRRPLAYVAHFDDFINSSGDGFVDGAAEHLTDINPQMKDALSTIMLQVADILRDLREAEETKNTELAKILRGNLAYLQDTVVDFVTDIIEGVQKEATDADLDEFADQLIDDVAHMATMASSAMMDKNSREMQRCRSLTAAQPTQILPRRKLAAFCGTTSQTVCCLDVCNPIAQRRVVTDYRLVFLERKSDQSAIGACPNVKTKLSGSASASKTRQIIASAHLSPRPPCAAAKSQYPDGLHQRSPGPRTRNIQVVRQRARLQGGDEAMEGNAVRTSVAPGPCSAGGVEFDHQHSRPVRRLRQ